MDGKTGEFRRTTSASGRTEWSDASGQTHWSDESGSMVRPRSARLVGRQIAGRYLVDRLVGTGSFAAVFECTDVLNHDTIALKLLHEKHVRSPEQVARFLREARFAHDIHHPGIARVLDSGVDGNGHVYIAMELLDGQELAAIVDVRQMAADTVAEIGRQLLDILAVAHGRGIVHRDIKPENIYLTTDEYGGMLVRLLDFGIAKSSSWSSVRARSTLDGVTLGTPHYMSPEQCMGRDVGPQSDLWAIGAVMYHALAGKPPHDEEQVGRLLQKIVNEDIPSIGTVRSDLPPALVATIDRALSRDLAKRWLTAREMQAALSPTLA